MPADRNILIRAVVILAKSTAHGDTAAAHPWLDGELARVTEALLQGATTIKSLSLTGLNATGDNEMRCDELAEILMGAIESIEGETDVGGVILHPRFGVCGIPI